MQFREDTRSRSPFRRPGRDVSPSPPARRADGGAEESLQRPAFRNGGRNEIVLICAQKMLKSPCSLRPRCLALTLECHSQRLMSAHGAINSLPGRCSLAAACWAETRTLLWPCSSPWRTKPVQDPYRVPPLLRAIVRVRALTPSEPRALASLTPMCVDEKQTCVVCAAQVPLCQEG